MTLSFVEFTPEVGEPPSDEHPYRRPRDRPKDRALVVYNAGEVKVLHHVGPDLETWEQETGEFCDEIVEDNIPNGLYIWEGVITSIRVWNYDGDEYDSNFKGTLRPLTPDEWFWFCEDPDTPPWDVSAWLVGRATEEEWFLSVHGCMP